MDDLVFLITQINQGKSDAYELIVRRFQDMAVGFAYARLGDRQLAEDAAQEAFINAYLDLPSLRDPAAFPGWFRRIVLKQIDRIQRRRRPTVLLDTLVDLTGSQASPVTVIEQQEVNDALFAAIATLPEAQREVVTLYYISEYAQNEISLFLDLPVSTIKMRLYHARQQLKTQLLALLEETLPNQRPSRNHTFMEKMMSFQIQTKTVPAQKVISMTRDSFIRDLQAHLDGCIKTLTVYAQTLHVQTAGLPIAIYHGSPREEEHGRVEICLPIAGEMQPTIEIAVKELAATEVAYTIATLRQSIYPGILKAHETIGTWLNDHGHQQAAAPREIYLNFNQSIFSPTASLDDPCVELAWPYR